ncbi:serine hydrolase [Streptomyces sp. W1SF4]|uniref:serine hydrolase n=1 Tax=Streptomyces sp. W1SF4 TaxID=2305220 RepID=UPI001F496F77|nr:serine hydrolase [Streptomyces sp. W1SF4]
MKAETVSNGARGGRSPQEGEPGSGAPLPDPTPKPPTAALPGREPQDTTPEPTHALSGRGRQDSAPAPTITPAGRGPQDTGPEPTDDPTGREPENTTQEPTDAPAGRGPQDSALAPTHAPAGREQQDNGPEPADAPAGRGPQDTGPEPANAPTGRGLQDTAPEPTDGPARRGRESATPEPTDGPAGRGPGDTTQEHADTVSGRGPRDSAPGAETDTPTRTLTRRETSALTGAGQKAAPAGALPGHGRSGADAESEDDARAGRGSDDVAVRREASEPANDTPGARGPAGTPAGAGQVADTDAESEDDVPAARASATDAPAQREGTAGAEDASPAGREAIPGDRAGGGDAPSRKRADADAESGTGTPAEQRTGHASDGGASTDSDAARGGQGAPAGTGGAPAGPVPDAEADTPTGPEPAGNRPGARETPDRTEPRSQSGTAAEPTTDGNRSGARGSLDRSGTRGGGAAGASGRPRPSWAKGDGPEEPADGSPRPSVAEAKVGEDAPAVRGGAGRGPASGGGAAARPHDPERTSEFVALRDPDALRPSRPQPRQQPAHRPAPAVLEPTREAPLPPLELLAELTNTAPPPETPRRTLTRRVKVWTPIVLLLGAAVAGAQMLRPLPAPQLVAAQTSHTIDGSTSIPWPAKGQAAVRIPGSGTIGTFGEQKPVPTASVAKIMTAYVVLKGHPLRKNEPGPKIEVDAKAVAEGNAGSESRIEGLTAGQRFSELDMIKMLMIPSGNNIARLLARWDTGGDEAAFVAKMNAAAKELGMTDTTYTDPSGLDAGTVSTAVDQLKLAEAVMKDDAFRTVVVLPSAPVEGLSKPLINNNGSLLLAGLNINGIKTGSSTPAGGTLSWAAYRTVGGETPLILGTMMDQHVDGPDPDGANSLELVKENSRKVIEAVRKALAPATVIRKGQLVGHVSDGLGGQTPLVATKDLTVIGVPGQRLRLSLGAGAKPLPHEAKAGTQAGVLTVGEGDGAKSVPVAVGADLVEPSFGARLTRLS